MEAEYEEAWIGVGESNGGGDDRELKTSCPDFVFSYGPFI